MIVYDLDIVSVSLAPTKTDAPLFIDPNAILFFPISGQFLKAISWRDTKVIQSLRRIQQKQLSLGDPPQTGGEFLRGLAMKYLFSFF